MSIQTILLLIFTILSIGTAIYLNGHSKNLNKIKSKIVGDGQHGNDRFMNDKEARDLYKTVTIPEEIKDMSDTFPSGRLINFNEKTREAYIDTSNSHFSIIAPTDSGKTTKYVIPNLQYNIMAGTTMVIPDTKKELYAKTADDARKLGYKVYLIDFGDPLNSHTYDYFEDLNVYTDEYLKTKDLKPKAMSESFAGKLAKMIVGSRDRADSENTFFLGASEGILHSMAILVSMFGDASQKHFSSINSLIQELMKIPKKPKESKPIIFKLLERFPTSFGAVKYFGPGFAATNETQDNIYASVIGDIKPFIDSLAEQIIARPDDDRHRFSYKNLVDEKSILYISFPDDEDQYKIFGSTIMKNLYNQLSIAARKFGGKLPKMILFLWEEMGLFPKIDNLKSTLSIARGKNILFDLIYQDSHQITDIYGENVQKIISSQCATTIYLAVGPEDIETAERISKSVGTKTIKTGSVSVSQDKNSGFFGTGVSHSKTEQMMERALMTPSEAMHMDMFDITLLLKRGHYPYKCHFTPYYKDTWGLMPNHDSADLEIHNEAREINCLSLEELLHRIDEYIDKNYKNNNSFITITKVPAAQRNKNKTFDSISAKLVEITGEELCVQLLKEKRYPELIKYMDQYKNQISRLELQQLIEPLAEGGSSL